MQIGMVIEEPNDLKDQFPIFAPTPSWFKVRETDAIETPAFRAISSIVSLLLGISLFRHFPDP